MKRLMKLALTAATTALVWVFAATAWAANGPGVSDDEILICSYQPMTGKISKPDDEWKKQLTSKQFQVTRKKGTEPPFTGEYYKNDREGLYLCV